jgi:hypothetical protein
MTLAMEWSNAELARVHAVAYQGRRARLCLAINSTALTKESTTAQWDAVEISSQAADGYARVVWTLPAGAYSSALGMVQGTGNLSTFQATSGGIGLEFDTAYLVLGTLSGGTTTWDTHVAGVLPMLPEDQTLSPGQPLSIEVFTLVDDITAVA